jgi:hypothetical protein
MNTLQHCKKNGVTPPKEWAGSPGKSN